MNYELVKRLKDAGYPLKEKDHGGTPYQWVEYKLPTLSELIEACGSKFHELHHCTHGWFEGEKNTWRWTAYPHTRNQADFNALQFTGSTPEEAVAKLWLALNSAPV